MIASHISNPKRIRYLKECFISLIGQTTPVTIYLSISFQTKELEQEFSNMRSENDLIKNSDKLVVLIQETKTPQMRHILNIYNQLQSQHKWILFCDDDDTYEPTRVEVFGNRIMACLEEVQRYPGKSFVGLYESTFGKNHHQHRHEYWCYCVHAEIMGRFMRKIVEYPDVLDNKCCDVLFAEYLRRLSQDQLFGSIDEKLYNYRIEDNSDSITGAIQVRQHEYTVHTVPPSIDSDDWAKYVLDWNDYLHDNLEVYLHDNFLRTLVGCPIDYIFQAEFRANAALLDYVDVSHSRAMTEFHHSLRAVCNELYDAKI